jgi:hypothetical protein
MTSIVDPEPSVEQVAGAGHLTEPSVRMAVEVKKMARALGH